MLGGDNRASKRSKVKLFTVEAPGSKGAGYFVGSKLRCWGLCYSGSIWRSRLLWPWAAGHRRTLSNVEKLLAATTAHHPGFSLR